jgi:GNAT superfamily N-acetyltransferase
LESSLVIRNFEPRDLQDCRALWRELTDWHREIYEDTTIGGDQPEQFFDKHLATIGPKQVWVAVRDLRVVGFVGLILKEDNAEVEPLIVSNRYRGKGIGRCLLEKAVTEARARGVKTLNIRPVARNIKTIQFLNRQGFTKIGFIELFMDFSQRSWKPGPEIFRCNFEF